MQSLFLVPSPAQPPRKKCSRSCIVLVFNLVFSPRDLCYRGKTKKNKKIIVIIPASNKQHIHKVWDKLVATNHASLLQTVKSPMRRGQGYSFRQHHLPTPATGYSTCTSNGLDRSQRRTVTNIRSLHDDTLNSIVTWLRNIMKSKQNEVYITRTWQYLQLKQQRQFDSKDDNTSLGLVRDTDQRYSQLRTAIPNRNYNSEMLEFFCLFPEFRNFLIVL